MTIPLSPEFLALQEVLAGRFSIEYELGRGGMGIVLLARDVALDRLVAIKLLPLVFASHQEHRDRFLQEARTAAGLSHPNIVPIHAVEAHGDLVFFIMGFVDGETLRDRVERAGPLSPRVAMPMMQEVAWALGYAHQRGVIHRDIKPDNIMIEQGTGRALVTDFGIALSQRDDERGVGEFIGTARYMSPEQGLGESLDARSDLYALGATFYYALTGKAPIDGETLPMILSRQMTGPAPQLAVARPGVPDKVAAVVDRCLETTPEDRWESGEDLARVIGEIQGRVVHVPPLVRNFVRNAQVTTMVFLASMVGGQGGGGQGFSIQLGGVIGIILAVQLLMVARRLLREGYVFDSIRDALLSEAQVQEEEAEELQQKKWLRRFNSLWYRAWAGWLGRRFFRLAGRGLSAKAHQVAPSRDATELILGRSTMAAFEALPEHVRRDMSDVPEVVEGLEDRAERLRARKDTGKPLNDTMAALENVRVALLKFQAGVGLVDDLTVQLDRARAVSEAVDRQLAGHKSVEQALAPDVGGG